MTTILIDFKTKKIVADRQTTCTDLQYDLFSQTYKELHGQVSYKLSNKIHKVAEGVYLVGAGNKGEVIRQAEHYRKYGTADIKAKDNCTLAVVRVKGEGLFADTYTYQKNKWKKGGTLIHKVVQGASSIVTFGSGSNYAYGAFMAGCSAEDSVRAASRCDQYTSYEIDVVEL